MGTVTMKTQSKYSESKVVISDWMSKLSGGMFHRYEKKFVVLRSDERLYIHKKESFENPGRHLLKVIDLAEITRLITFQRKEGTPGISLHTKKSHFTFHLENLEVRESWSEALKAVVVKYHPDALREALAPKKRLVTPPPRSVTTTGTPSVTRYDVKQLLSGKWVPRHIGLKETSEDTVLMIWKRDEQMDEQFSLRGAQVQITRETLFELRLSGDICLHLQAESAREAVTCVEAISSSIKYQASRDTPPESNQSTGTQALLADNIDRNTVLVNPTEFDDSHISEKDWRNRLKRRRRSHYNTMCAHTPTSTSHNRPTSRYHTTDLTEIMRHSHSSERHTISPAQRRSSQQITLNSSDIGQTGNDMNQSKLSQDECKHDIEPFEHTPKRSTEESNTSTQTPDRSHKTPQAGRLSLRVPSQSLPDVRIKSHNIDQSKLGIQQSKRDIDQTAHTPKRPKPDSNRSTRTPDKSHRTPQSRRFSLDVPSRSHPNIRSPSHEDSLRQMNAATIEKRQKKRRRSRSASKLATCSPHATLSEQATYTKQVTCTKQGTCFSQATCTKQATCT
eukprot:441197_1